MVNNGYSENPSEFLEQHFRDVHEHSMSDLKLCNKHLEVAAVGFHLYENHWFGIMITPWFLNLMILPQEGQPWPELVEQKGNDIALEFPCGNLKFTPRVDPVIGSHLVCSLESPLIEYKAQQEILNTAQQILVDINRIPMTNVDEPASPSKRSLFTNLTAG